MLKLHINQKGMYLPLKRKLPNITSKIPPIAAMAVILLGWEVVSISGIVPSYMLPSPVAVLTALFGDLPTILFPCEIHFAGILLRTSHWNRAGICVCNYDGSVPCNGSGILSDHDHYADHTDHCLAPILVLWMGFGMAPKITLVVITTFFPITIGLLDGYKSVDPDAIRLMKAMGASRAQIFRHVKFPGALPQFFSGLKNICFLCSCRSSCF